MKKLMALTLMVAMLVAAVGVAAFAFGLLPTFDSDSGVEAKGNGLPDGSKLVYKFNLVGFPEGQTHEEACNDGTSQGHRIFVNRNASHAHIDVFDHDDGWHVADCWASATGGDRAVLHTDQLGEFDVYVRILGKPSGDLKICANTKEDHDVFGVDDPFCLLGTIVLHRETGQSKFSVQPDSIFDAELEAITWTVITDKDYRNAQFVVVDTTP